MNPSLPPPERKVFLSLFTVVLLCLSCLIGAAIFAIWGYRSRFTDTAKLERERAALTNQLHRADLERLRGTEDTRLALARTRQTEALSRIHAATNALGQLLVETATVAGEAAKLRTNDTGRLAALHPDLIVLARRFYETELRDLPPAAQVIQKIEGVRRLEQQLISAQGTAYEPETSLLVSSETSLQWANDRLQKSAQIRTLLSTITQEAKIKFTTATVNGSSPTLDDAMQQVAQAEAGARQNIILQQTGSAKTNAARTLAQAEADRIIAAAKLEAEKIKREVEDARAELSRQQAVNAADEQLKNAKATVAAEQKVDEATRVAARKKASDPKIQSKLAPFLTPGYMDAYGKTMVEKKPHSYSVLKSGGALEPTMAGLQKIADLAYTRIDKVRPRWNFHKYNSRGWRYNPQEMEMVKEAQRLLDELGPVMVEMGLMEP